MNRQPLFKLLYKLNWMYVNFGVYWKTLLSLCVVMSDFVGTAWV